MMKTILFLAMAVGCGGAFAQGSPAESFNAMLSGVEKQVMSLVEAMPADKYGFAPDERIFLPAIKTDFAGVRTFSGLVTHVAQANYGLAGRIGGVKPDVDVAAIGKLKEKAQVVEALRASFAFVHQAIGTLTAENAFESVQGIFTPTTRASAAAFVVVHIADEYGQMVEYLRMNGLVPPASVKKPT